jgi:iron complex outermembrane receptor protein
MQYDFDYQSGSESNLFPSPITHLPSSWMHNARVSIGREEFGWELYGFVRNLTDTDRKAFAYDLTAFIGRVLESYAPPRTYGVGFRKTF